MKRFLLFAGMTYYPSGGWHDFKMSFDSVSAALSFAEQNHSDNGWNWWHVIDSTTGQYANGH